MNFRINKRVAWIYLTILVVTLTLLVVVYIYYTNLNMTNLTNLPPINMLNQIDYTSAQTEFINYLIPAENNYVLSAGISVGEMNVVSQDVSQITGKIMYLGKKPKINSNNKDQLTTVSIESEQNSGEKYDFIVPKNNNGSLQIGGGTLSAVLDLRQSKIATVNVLTQSGIISLVTPEGNNFIAGLQSGDGNITISIPQNAGVKLIYTDPASIQKTSLDSPNYQTVTDGYQSNDFDTASIQVLIKIGPTAGIQVTRY